MIHHSLRRRIGVSMAVLMMTLLIWDQSYNGRQEVVQSSRANCERNAIDRAAQVNLNRDVQADNANTARSRGIPPTVKASKRDLVAKEERLIEVQDSHIDRGDWWRLASVRDQRIVRYGQWMWEGQRHVYVRPFRCEQAFPSASPFQFGGL